ncbi:hypothetical protein POTOM_044095 [Populus tomentosa]|uniref:superoxide dismutase n=1 Tax=Populus tomentosa TaxID=118781 RepID=A0A8X8CG02_POPTO|nr:hypothetical protein POTOM_044095 [Populus tomentosa]
MATVSVKAVALITGDSNVRGSLHFIQEPNGATHVTGRITGLSPGLHGFHIHALGDTTNGCNSTGPHFNPLKKDHGAPSDNERHAGDLGNITAGSDGVAEVSIKDLQIPLSGMHSILGRAVVVHADPDDLGKGGHELSKTTGNAGARVGCGNTTFSCKHYLDIIWHHWAQIICLELILDGVMVSDGYAPALISLGYAMNP